MAQPLLRVEDLSVRFSSKAGDVDAVKNVSLSVEPGGSFGLVGESGSGKSTVLRAVAGLVPARTGTIAIGTETPGRTDRRSLARVRQMVFQDPYGSLHPRQTVEAQLDLALRIHRVDGRAKKIGDALDAVGLEAGFRFRYPHQLSGGQRQRVAIARALILEPQLLLLDEPTSALDVSVQAEILNLLMRLRRERGLTYVLVSHDLSVVATLCDALAIMKEGSIVERMDLAQLQARDARTDYAARLLSASDGALTPPSETAQPSSSSSSI